MWLLFALFAVLQVISKAQNYDVPPPGPPIYIPRPPGPSGSYNPAYPHHEYSSSSSESESDSISESHSHSHSFEEDCTECENVKHHCHHSGSYGHHGHCVKPKVKYVYTHSKRDGKHCRQALISCPHESYTSWTLETSKYNKLFNGQGFSTLATCNRKGKWSARDVNGYKVSFRRVKCMRHQGDGGSGYPEQPIYTPDTPVYPPVYTAPVDQSSYPQAPVYGSK